jgi:hypothetical protein
VARLCVGRQKRHIGNDPVQIIWNDHYRAYDPRVIRSAVGQVQLVVTPLPNTLYRIDVRRDPAVRAAPVQTGLALATIALKVIRS